MFLSLIIQKSFEKMRIKVTYLLDEDFGLASHGIVGALGLVQGHTNLIDELRLVTDHLKIEKSVVFKLITKQTSSSV